MGKQSASDNSGATDADGDKLRKKGPGFSAKGEEELCLSAYGEAQRHRRTSRHNKADRNQSHAFYYGTV